MLKLVSVGDRFPFDRFAEVHSRFERVINFVYKKQVVSLVTPEVGAGPFRIEIELAELSSVQILEYRAGSVILNDCLALQAEDNLLYNSSVSFDFKDKDNVQKGIAFLKEFLLNQKIANSMLFLLTDKAYPVSSKFDAELAKQFRQAYQFLQKQKYEQAAASFKGRGYGFTPSGDDFNAGLLIGLQVRQQTEKKELSKIRDSIYQISPGNSLPVNTLLLQAYKGWYDEQWKNLLLTLQSEHKELQSAAEKVLAQGETSGTDALTGFLAAWEIKI